MARFFMKKKSLVTLGDKVRYARESKHISLEDLATTSGIPLAHIKKIEENALDTEKINIETIKKLAQTLHKSTGYFLETSAFRWLWVKRFWDKFTYHFKLHPHVWGVYCTILFLILVGLLFYRPIRSEELKSEEHWRIVVGKEYALKTAELENSTKRVELELHVKALSKENADLKATVVVLKQIIEKKDRDIADLKTKTDQLFVTMKKLFVDAGLEDIYTEESGVIIKKDGSK